MDFIEDRVGALGNIEHDRLGHALTWAEALELEGHLRQVFGIAQLPRETNWPQRVAESSPPAVAGEYWRLNDQRAEYLTRGKRIPKSLENQFYGLLARTPALFSLVHSQKHTMILDAASLLTRVARCAGLFGSALDLGCNGGYHATWLARATQLGALDAIDCNGPTVEYASRKVRELGLADRVRVTQTSFPCRDLRGPYELIYSIDGALTWKDADAWRAAEALLSDGGVLVYVDDLGDSPLPATSLACVAADVTGGWSGLGFESKLAMVFVRGARVPRRRDIAAVAARFWDERFQEYANSGVDCRWKSQTFCRTWLVHGAPPPALAPAS